MLVTIKSSVAGKGFSFPRGTHEVPDEIAEMLIEAGHAEMATAKRGKRGGSDKLGDSSSGAGSGSDSTD